VVSLIAFEKSGSMRTTLKTNSLWRHACVPANASWIIKNIMQQRDNIRHNQIWSDMLNASKFNMKNMYMAVQDGSPVMWRTLFYGNMARPRALVNLWIACN
jgi:hypothetical protein